MLIIKIRIVTLICVVFSQQIKQLCKHTVFEVFLLFINMLSILVSFPAPLLSTPRVAKSGNESIYILQMYCVNTERYLLYIVLAHLLQNKTPLFTCSNTLACVNADRYIAVYCLISLQYKSSPFYLQNGDRYIAEYCLTSFQYRSNPFYQQNADRYIIVYCLTSFQYRSKTHFLSFLLH